MSDGKNDLTFLPLGGVGEIGLNVYLYGEGERRIMVDLGITFPDDRLPGAEIVLPDLRALKDFANPIEALVLTHAHEDHIGAVPQLWPKMRCPIFCSRFTSAVLRRKLNEAGVDARGLIREIEPGKAFTAGPFECRFIPVTHSILESAALVIETSHGRVLHTGDWKLDPAPLVGAKTDDEALERLGDGHVMAIVCDSTNVLSPGVSGSEAEVRDSLIELIDAQPNRVVFTTFASNLARLETAIVAGHAAGREVAMVGRSMHRMLEAAQECGYLKDLRPLIDEREAVSLPRERVLLLCTGSQGESRAALARIAAGNHPRIRLDAGDTVIFSAKIIPGNERLLFNLHNQLVGQGIEVITEEDHFVHVSGHPSRDELEQMYRWIRPKIAVPIHGEARHLSAHVRFARKMDVEHAVLIGNGDVLRLAPGKPVVIGSAPTGRMVLENDVFVDAEGDLFRERRRIMNHGAVTVSLVADTFGSVLDQPRISAFGVVSHERLEKVRAELGEAIVRAVDALDDDMVMDDGRVAEVVRSCVRQVLDLSRQSRPLIEVHVVRLGQDALDQIEGIDDEEEEVR